MVTSIRVAGIWIVEGAILLESLTDREVWGVPGGRLEAGESLEEGVAREYREETGFEMRCTGLAIVNEGFWSTSGGPVREYGFYFRVAPVAPVPSPRPPVRSLEERLRFAWFDLAGLRALTIVPGFLTDVLPSLGPGTRFVHARD